jgi:hypothetical protein
MSINIKNKEADDLLAAIKGITGKGASRIVLELLRAEYGRLTGTGAAGSDARAEAEQRRVQRALDATRDVQALWRESPVLDPRPLKDILDGA